MTQPGNTPGRGRKRRPPARARVRQLFDDLVTRDPAAAEALLVVLERAIEPRGAKLLEAVGVVVHFAVTQAGAGGVADRPREGL